MTDEWTISKDNTSNFIGAIANVGSWSAAPGSSVPLGVRPVFYLNDDVALKKDNSTDGSREHPFRIVS